MRAYVGRQAAAIASLSLCVITPAEAPHPGGVGNAGSGVPIKTISASTLADGQIAAAVRHELTRLGQLDDDALPTDPARRPNAVFA